MLKGLASCYEYHWVRVRPRGPSTHFSTPLGASYFCRPNNLTTPFNRENLKQRHISRWAGPRLALPLAMNTIGLGSVQELPPPIFHQLNLELHTDVVTFVDRTASLLPFTEETQSRGTAHSGRGLDLTRL